MLTTLTILSLDQGKIWRDPAAGTPALAADPEPAGGRVPRARDWLRRLRSEAAAIRLPGRATAGG